MVTAAVCVHVSCHATFFLPPLQEAELQPTKCKADTVNLLLSVIAEVSVDLYMILDLYLCFAWRQNVLNFRLHNSLGVCRWLVV